MKIEQTAGNCAAHVYTDGYPLFPEISIIGGNGEKLKVRITVNDLHDIRYCVDRLLAQMPTA